MTANNYIIHKLNKLNDAKVNKYTLAMTNENSIVPTIIEPKVCAFAIFIYNTYT